MEVKQKREQRQQLREQMDDPVEIDEKSLWKKGQLTFFKKSQI